MDQPFIAHVHELRRRLSWTVLVLGIGAGLAYLARNPILDWLKAPLHSTLYYSQVMGAFNFLMQACFLVGVLFAIPVLVYNLISFVRPALPRPVTRVQIAVLVTASCVLTLAGVAFAYYVSLPAVLHFLGTIDVSHLHPLIAADSYLSFVMTYLGTFAAIFQLPLILLFIDRIRPLPPKRLKGIRKFVVIGSFAAALVLPIAPDPVSQIMLAVPVVLLYEVSLWLISLQHLARQRRQRRAEAEAVAATPMQAPAPVHAQGRTRPMERPMPARPAPAPRQAPGYYSLGPAVTRAPRVIDLRQHHAGN